MGRDGAGDEQVQVSVRVPVELVTALEQAAKEGDRTLSAELRRAIRRHVGALTVAPTREAA